LQEKAHNTKRKVDVTSIISEDNKENVLESANQSKRGRKKVSNKTSSTINKNVPTPKKIATPVAKRTRGAQRKVAQSIHLN